MTWDAVVARWLEYDPIEAMLPEIPVQEGGYLPKGWIARARVLPWGWPNSKAPVLHYFILRLPSYRWKSCVWDDTFRWHQLTLVWSSFRGWSFEWWADG